MVVWGFDVVTDCDQLWREGFMFRLSADETARLRSQIVTLKTGQGGREKVSGSFFQV